MVADSSLKKGVLSDVWRRVVIPRMAIGLSLLTGACTTQRGPDMAPEDGHKPPTPPGSTLRAGPNPPDTLTITVDDQVILPPERKAEHARFRQRMLHEARQDFAGLSALAETSYSGELKSLHARLTSYLVASANPVHNSVAYVDPAKFDVGMALGFQVPKAVQLILAQEGVTPSAGDLKNAAHDMAAPYHFRLQDVDVFSQSPHALYNRQRGTADACVVVPSSAFALTIDIQGLSTEEQVKFTNRHESWHCLDHFFVEQSLDPKLVAAIPAGNLAHNINNRTALALYAISCNKESLADIGAIGDMIRHDNYGIGLVHTIAAWRQRYPGDIQHISSPSLNGFRDKVERMGVEAFRKLSDRQATDLYVDTVREYGMTPRSLYIQLRYEAGTPAERTAWQALARTDNDAWRAANLLQYYMGKPEESLPGPLTPREQKLLERLNGWNAGGLLEQHAFDIAGSITPRSLIRAYGDMQRALQDQLDAGTRDPLVPVQMGKLQQTFIYQVRNTDYIEANRRRGVDIAGRMPERVAAAPGLRVSAAAPGP